MKKHFHIEYFGILADKRGVMQETVQSDAVTAEEIYETLLAQHALGLSKNDLRAAVNDHFVEWSQELFDQDRIAFLPPMSGG